MVALMSDPPTPLPTPTPVPNPAPAPPFPLPLPAQWSSPLWWASVVNFGIQEVISFSTLFHATSWVARLSSVTQGEIVMVSQALAVVGFLIYAWIHHQQVKAVIASHQSYNQAVGQIHYNNAVASTERYRLALEAGDRNRQMVQAGQA